MKHYEVPSMSLLLLVKQNRNATLKAEHFDMSLGRRQVLKAGWRDAEEPAARLTLALILHPQARGKERLHSIQQDPEGYDQLSHESSNQNQAGGELMQFKLELCWSTPRSWGLRKQTGCYNLHCGKIIDFLLFFYYYFFFRERNHFYSTSFFS